MRAVSKPLSRKHKTVGGSNSNIIRHHISVQNVHSCTSKEKLHALFSNIGKINNLQLGIVIESLTEKPCRVAFVEFDNPKTAYKVKLQNHKLDGNQLVVCVNDDTVENAESVSKKRAILKQNIKRRVISEDSVQKREDMIFIANNLRQILKTYIEKEMEDSAGPWKSKGILKIRSFFPDHFCDLILKQIKKECPMTKAEGIGQAGGMVKYSILETKENKFPPERKPNSRPRRTRPYDLLISKVLNDVVLTIAGEHRNMHKLSLLTTNHFDSSAWYERAEQTNKMITKPTATFHVDFEANVIEELTKIGDLKKSPIVMMIALEEFNLDYKGIHGALINEDERVKYTTINAEKGTLLLMRWDVMHRTGVPIWDTNKKSKPSPRLHVLIGREEDNLDSGGQTECYFEDYELLDFFCSGKEATNIGRPLKKQKRN